MDDRSTSFFSTSITKDQAKDSGMVIVLILLVIGLFTKDDFYFSGIETVFSGYGSMIIVLFMPDKNNEPPDKALLKALADHPGIIFADGLQAIQKYGVTSRDYVGIHPKPAAHKAYALEIIDAARTWIK